MNWLNLIPNIFKGANDLAGTVFGSRAARDEQAHEENTAGMAEYAAEFQSRPERDGWFDSLVDGLNRIQRPTYTFSTLALFWFAYANPLEFAKIMQGMALIPEPLWVIMGLIVGFLFSSRMIEKLPVGTAFKGISQKTVDTINKQVATMDVDTTPTGSNSAIQAWKSSR